MRSSFTSTGGAGRPAGTGAGTEAGGGTDTTGAGAGADTELTLEVEELEEEDIGLETGSEGLTEGAKAFSIYAMEIRDQRRLDLEQNLGVSYMTHHTCSYIQVRHSIMSSTSFTASDVLHICVNGHYLHELARRFHALPAVDSPVCALVLVREADVMTRLRDFFAAECKSAGQRGCLFTASSFEVEEGGTRAGYSYRSVTSFPFRCRPLQTEKDIADCQCRVMLATFDKGIKPAPATDSRKPTLYHYVTLREDVKLLIPPAGSNVCGGFLIGPKVRDWPTMRLRIEHAFRMIIAASDVDCGCVSTRDAKEACAAAVRSTALLNVRDCMVEHPIRALPMDKRDSKETGEDGVLLVSEEDLARLEKKFGAFLTALNNAGHREKKRPSPTDTRLFDYMLLPQVDTLRKQDMSIIVVDPETDSIYQFKVTENEWTRYAGCGFHPLARSPVTGAYSTIALRVHVPHTEIVTVTAATHELRLPAMIVQDAFTEDELRTPAVHATRLARVRARLGGDVSPLYFHYTEGFDNWPWAFIVPPVAPLRSIAEYERKFFDANTFRFAMETRLNFVVPHVYSCLHCEFGRLRTGDPLITGSFTRLPLFSGTAALTMPCSGVYAFSDKRHFVLQPDIARKAIDVPLDDDELAGCALARFPVLELFHNAYKGVLTSAAIKNDPVAERLARLLIQPEIALRDAIAAAEAKGIKPTTPIDRKLLDCAFCPAIYTRPKKGGGPPRDYVPSTSPDLVLELLDRDRYISAWRQAPPVPRSIPRPQVPATSATTAMHIPPLVLPPPVVSSSSSIRDSISKSLFFGKQ